MFCKIKVSRYISELKVRVERCENSPDHEHLLEESDKLKRSQAVISLVEQEAQKNYRPPAILSAVKEIATEKLGLGESAKELRRKEFTNIKFKIRDLLIHILLEIQNANWIFMKQLFFLNKKDIVLNVSKLLCSLHKASFLHNLVKLITLNNMDG